jgi:hypothetical protein
VALGAVAAFASPRALADPQPGCGDPPPPRVVSSAHFKVWYTDDPAKTGYVSETQAGSVLAAAERAYASYSAAGFPTPAVMGSGKTEYTLIDLSPWKLAGIYCIGGAFIDTKSVTGSDMEFQMGMEVFAQITLKITVPQNWLLNGTAAWASWRVLGYPGGSISDIGPFDMALDCDSASDKVNCSSVGYENLGASRWPFYEYLTEKYGPLFIINVFNATAAAGGDGLVGLQNALIAKGTTLGAEYGAYASKLLYGGWTATTLNAATIPVSGTTVLTGASSGAIPPQLFGVNHLATKYVEIDRGDGDGSHACYAATLTLNVKIPAGVTSQPTFYWTGGGSSPVALTISGTDATTTVPWDTCKWTSKGFLSLPNTSNVDGQSFAVSGSLAVDFSTPVTAAAPPSPSSPYGPVVDASSVSLVPAVSLAGSKVIKLKSDDTELKLALQSSGEGSVRVTLASTTLGTVPVSTGGNALRFTLPKDWLLSQRRSAGVASTLTLTPIAPDGKTTGASITRSVSVEPSAVAPKRTVKKTSLQKRHVRKK